MVPGSKRDIALDTIVTLSALALSLPVLLVRPGNAYAAVTDVLLVVSALALFYRRRAPVTVAWITVAAACWLPVAGMMSPHAALAGVEINTVAWWPLSGPFAVYSLLSLAGGRRWIWLPVALILLSSLALAKTIDVGPVLQSPSSHTPSSFALGFRGFAFVAGGALLGLFIAARRRTLAVLTERANRAERERYLLAEQARAEERSRLAAEMHDIVTHRVSLMVMQAGALRVSARDEETRAAAEELRVVGCQALAELRDVVGLLRSAPQDGLSAARAEEPVLAVPDLSTLVAESESVGVLVEVVEEGDRLLASPVVSRTAFRVVQEALTNVRKHAPGASVRVLVSYRGASVRLVVENSAPTLPQDRLLADSGSGTGLAGLRQRVELISGTLRVGPREGGGYRLEAALPAFVPTVERLEKST